MCVWSPLLWSPCNRFSEGNNKKEEGENHVLYTLFEMSGYYSIIDKSDFLYISVATHSHTDKSNYYISFCLYPTLCFLPLFVSFFSLFLGFISNNLMADECWMSTLLSERWKYKKTTNGWTLYIDWLVNHPEYTMGSTNLFHLFGRPPIDKPSASSSL